MSKKSFTTEDLLIVLMTIGIVSAIAAPTFITARNRAKKGSTKAEEP